MFELFFLPMACLLVIRGFTAQRQVEIETLQAECCSTVDNNVSIRLYSAKVIQDYQDFPATKLIQRVVAVLERLSESARGMGPNDQGLLRLYDLTGAIKPLWVNFNAFCGFVGVVGKDYTGLPFVFSEHQFRRFLQ